MFTLNCLHIDQLSVWELAQSHSLKDIHTHKTHWNSMWVTFCTCTITLKPPLGKYSSTGHESRNKWHSLSRSPGSKRNVGTKNSRTHHSHWFFCLSSHRTLTCDFLEFDKGWRGCAYGLDGDQNPQTFQTDSRLLDKHTSVWEHFQFKIIYWYKSQHFYCQHINTDDISTSQLTLTKREKKEVL